METVVAVVGGLMSALLTAGIVALIRLYGKVEALIEVVNGHAQRLDDHKADDDRRFQRLENHAWPQSRAR